MQDKTSLVSTGIVPRLRITFIVVAGILIAQLFIGITLSRALNRSIDDLTRSALNIFLITEESERELKNLVLLLQGINTVKTEQDLPALKTQLDQKLSDLGTIVAKIADAGIDAEMSTNMSTALQTIDKGASNVALAKRASLTHTVKIQNFSQQLETIAPKIRLILDSLSFEATKDTENAIKTVAEQNARSSPLSYENINKSHALSNTLTTIALQLEAIIVKANSFKNLSSLDALNQKEQELRFDLRGVIVLTSLLKQNPQRLELVHALSSLRDLIIAKDGLVPEVFAKTEQLQTLNQLLVAQNEPMTLISSLSQLLNQRATNRVQKSRNELNIATRNLIIVAALTTLTALLAIGSANILVVEHQINRRMGQLTTAVLSIAAGDTTYDVNVSGPDELGKIARALEIFKTNAEELNRSNVELEKFAYAAAHDLRSPLRAIQDLLQWTLEDEENVFSEDGQANMALLQARIKRLNLLLSDLLEYSRVGQEYQDLSELSLDKVVREISDLVDPEKHFAITYSGHPEPVTTYATPLRQILLNLISNGVKHHDQTKGQITVHTHLENDRIHITVSDDGPGIPTAYQDRVFGLFETLKPRDEVEGSGLGLAIIRKSLEHQKGKIRLKSEPETTRGSSFSFDLPEMSAQSTELQNAA